VTRRWVRPSIVRWLSGLLASVLMVAALSGLLVLLRPWLLPLRTVYLLAVVPVAIVWGTGLAALTAVLSAVVYAYLFIPPSYSLKIPACRTLRPWGFSWSRRWSWEGWRPGRGGRR